MGKFKSRDLNLNQISIKRRFKFANKQTFKTNFQTLNLVNNNTLVGQTAAVVLVPSAVPRAAVKYHGT